MPRPICWRAGSTSSRNWWRSASVDGETRYSLSCNTDTTLDHSARPCRGPRVVQAVRAGQFRTAVHAGCRAILPADEFSAVLDSPETDFPLFAPPAEPVSDTKYAIGLHAAGLVRDGGTLQIGIGQVGDALAQGLIVRHRDNAQLRARSCGGFRPAPDASRAKPRVRKGPLRRQRDADRGVSSA